MNNESSFLARFTTGAHLGGIGLENFEPYLMNRIMGRYNASIRDDVIKLDLRHNDRIMLVCFKVEEFSSLVDIWECHDNDWGLVVDSLGWIWGR